MYVRVFVSVCKEREKITNVFVCKRRKREREKYEGGWCASVNVSNI